jgi:hypothetical protein
MAIDVHPQLPRVACIFLKSAELEDQDVHSDVRHGPLVVNALSLIAQTAPDDGPNVKTTLCASVRKEQVTLRIGRKR